MKRIVYPIILVLFTVATGIAQEYGAYSQYLVNPVLVNPALTGFNGGHDLLLNYKRQWAGFEGTPSMVTFNYNGQLSDNGGIGLNIFSESAAAVRRFRLSGAYAYHLQLSDMKIGLGLQADYVQEKLSNDVLTNGGINPDDPILLAAADGISFFDAAFGFHARYKDNLYFGFSLPHLVRARLTDVEGTDDAEGTGLKSFTANIGYNYALPDLDMSIDPSIMVRKMFNGPISIDGNLLFTFLDQQLYGGLTYRYTVDAGSGLGVLIGTRFSNVSVYYSYDAGFGSFSAYNNGGHEFGLGFRIGKTQKTTPIEQSPASF